MRTTSLTQIQPGRRLPTARAMEQVRSPNTRSPTRYVTVFHILPVFRRNSDRQGTDAQAAYQLIHDELTLDGSPLLNLASFVHTWMPEQADKLMIENMSKNLIDQDEYPITRELP